MKAFKRILAMFAVVVGIGAVIYLLSEKKEEKYIVINKNRFNYY